jgi:hypothetical protein
MGKNEATTVIFGTCWVIGSDKLELEMGRVLEILCSGATPLPEACITKQPGAIIKKTVRRIIQ